MFNSHTKKKVFLDWDDAVVVVVGVGWTMSMHAVEVRTPDAVCYPLV